MASAAWSLAGRGSRTRGLAANLAADGQYFAVFANGHHRQLPRLTEGPFRYKTFASEYVKEAVKMATKPVKPVKQAVIASSMLFLLYPLDGKVEGYSRKQFLDDLCEGSAPPWRGPDPDPLTP